MKKSLLFLPDISGFTNFVQTTEIAHSQHVISELLEVLLEANTINLQLAEVEGDALFFFKENDIPSPEKLLNQVETMFSAFYSHLKLLEKNRICPCNACLNAPNLELKIIAHCGELQFITVQNKRKPFGTSVIEVHRLMKNSVKSDNYLLLSIDLVKQIELSINYQSHLFSFSKGSDDYDGVKLDYMYSILQKEQLNLRPFAQAKKIKTLPPPTISSQKEFPVSAEILFEYITNYAYRHEWVKGVDKFEYHAQEVTRLGTEHACVIDGKQLNLIAITKDGEPGQLIYGEMTTNPKPVDELYGFYIITPLTQNSCKLETETYIIGHSFFKKLLILFVIKRIFKKNVVNATQALFEFVQKDMSISK